MPVRALIGVRRSLATSAPASVAPDVGDRMLKRGPVKLLLRRVAEVSLFMTGLG